MNNAQNVNCGSCSDLEPNSTVVTAVLVRVQFKTSCFLYGELLGKGRRGDCVTVCHHLHPGDKGAFCSRSPFVCVCVQSNRESVDQRPRLPYLCLLKLGKITAISSAPPTCLFETMEAIFKVKPNWPSLVHFCLK